MKVLMISGDATVLDSSFPAEKRTKEYRKVLGELDVLLCYGNIFSFIAGLFRGPKLMRQKKFDVITAQSPEHWLLACILSYFFRVPWQMQIHTDIFSPYFVKNSVFNKIRVLLAKFLIPRANGIRVVSEKLRRSILLRLNLDSIVLPILVDVKKNESTPIKTDLHQKYPGKFIILMASRLTKEKNIELAIEAASSLILENGRIMLLVVGEGPEKENLQHIVYDLKLNENVVFEPWVGDLVPYYKTCDLFLLTSNYEGYGMTLVEASVTGAKIISSDVGIAPEILDRENIFKVDNKDDLTAKLTLAIDGKIKLAKPLLVQTKEEYLRLYKEGLEKCIKK